MKLYENVIIGNFLYGLGLDIGIKIGLDNGTETLPEIIINLLQQTPADKELGDMLWGFHSYRCGVLSLKMLKIHPK